MNAGAGGGGGAGADDAGGPAESDDAAASVPLAAEVRLAGVENKEKMYEPKHNRKLVRVLTVVAYVFSVSLAAIMLSLYYVFLWKPTSHQELLYRQHHNKNFQHVPPTLGTATPPKAVAPSKALAPSKAVPPPSPQTSPIWQNVFPNMNQYYSSSTASSEEFLDTTDTVPPGLLDADLGASLRAVELPTQESAVSMSPEATSVRSAATLPSAPSPLPPPPSSVSAFSGTAPNLHQIVMGRHLPQDSLSHHLRNSHYRGRDRNEVEAKSLNRFNPILSLGGT